MRFVKQTSWALALCVLGGALSSVANAQNEQVTRMKAALASPDRPAKDKDRDAARKPIETVQFAGIKTGQTVLEVIAVGGWFTEVLSAADDLSHQSEKLRADVNTFLDRIRAA